MAKKSTSNPPSGGGRPVYAGEVMSRMKMLRIPMVRKLIVEQIIERASGKPERLVEWPEGAKLSASLEVYISDDNMLATCVMHRPKKGGGSLTEEELLDALKEREVTDCDGDVFARCIENAKVRCSGNLIVEEAIMHSEINVGGNLLLTGKRAELIAGRSIVGGSVWCKKLGNVSEIKTTLRLGIEPATLERVTQLKTAIGEKREILDTRDAELKRLTEHIKSRQRVSQEESERLKELNADVQNFVMELKALQGEHHKLNSTMDAEVDCTLVVEQIMFHGASVVFGHTDYPVPLKGVRKTIFKMKDDTICESGYNPYDPPRLEFKT